MGKLFITNNEIISDNLPMKFKIINDLKNAGAPIKILRNSFTDVSDYKDDEIELTGTINRIDDIENGISFWWEK